MDTHLFYEIVIGMVPLLFEEKKMEPSIYRIRNIFSFIVMFTWRKTNKNWKEKRLFRFDCLFCNKFNQAFIWMDF